MWLRQNCPHFGKWNEKVLFLWHLAHELWEVKNRSQISPLDLSHCVFSLEATFSLWVLWTNDQYSINTFICRRVGPCIACIYLQSFYWMDTLNRKSENIKSCHAVLSYVMSLPCNMMCMCYIGWWTPWHVADGLKNVYKWKSCVCSPVRIICCKIAMLHCSVLIYVSIQMYHRF